MFLILIHACQFDALPPRYFPYKKAISLTALRSLTLSQLQIATKVGGVYQRARLHSKESAPYQREVGSTRVSTEVYRASVVAGEHYQGRFVHLFGFE